MTRLAKSALVARPPAAMFDLVNDVDAYPRRFDWCEDAAVLERSGDDLVARLSLRMAGVSATFTTRNTTKRPHEIDMSLVEGPFSSLSGEWRFEPLGDAGTKVSLVLDFDFAGKLVGSALAIGFRKFADRLVDDFVRVAKRDT